MKRIILLFNNYLKDSKIKKCFINLKGKYFALLLLLFFTSQIFAEPCGDVNSNGMIDIVDALLIVRYYVNLNPSNFDESAADVNCNGLIDIVDALLVVRYYVGLISELPGCCHTPSPTTTPIPTPAPPQMPIYHVNRTGIEQEEGNNLGQRLRMDENILNSEEFMVINGLLDYVDKENFGYIPVINNGPGDRDESGEETVLESIDFNGLNALEVLSKDEAVSRFTQALENLLPENAEVFTGNMVFLATQNTPPEGINIDTSVEYNVYLDSIPLKGPGSKISVVFGDHGRVTSLQYAYRKLEKGRMMEILTEEEVKQKIRAKYEKVGNNDLNINLDLFYYAPPLDDLDVGVIIPYYNCTITTIEEDQEVASLEEIIPALADSTYVPVLNLEASFTGNEVVGNVSIEGGVPPYTLQWDANGLEESPQENTVSYIPAIRQSNSSHILSVTVTDQNGVSVTASTILSLSNAFTLVVNAETFATRAGSVRDFGTENPVFYQFGTLEKGFVKKMKQDSVTKNFQWKGYAAWEQDFKPPHDNSWIDNTDMTLYVGHGNPCYFKFLPGVPDDSYLYHTNANDAWGNVDLEWLALWSCNVLKLNSSCGTVFDRWKQEFDGLHLLLGFRTKAWAKTSFGTAFARNMLKKNMTVRSAWFKAIHTNQPWMAKGVVMGVIHNNGWVNCNDHFWGHGSVGPDITKPNITGYWIIFMT